MVAKTEFENTDGESLDMLNKVARVKVTLNLVM